MAALMGLAFKSVLYGPRTCATGSGRPGPSGRGPPSAGSHWLLLLALPQMYGVGYPVLYKAVGGRYALWFLIVLAAGKIFACSLTIGIGGSGGVFAPSLFIGATPAWRSAR